MKSIVYRYPFQAKDRAEIHATLLDFRRFGEIHPVIVSVAVVSGTPPGPARYFVKERVKIGGWLPMKPQYSVDVKEIEPGHRIRYTSRIMGIMKLQIDLTMTEEDANGEIELLESVQVSKIPLVTKIFLGVFVSAHIQAYQTLRRKLEQKATI